MVAARLFLENLLLPPVTQAVREHGVLRYPLRADFAASWVLHRDIADSAAALLARRDVTDVVAIGQHPPLTGPDLAEAFSIHFGHPVSYQALAPSTFGQTTAPTVGDLAAAAITVRHELFSTLARNAIPREYSAQ